MDDVGRAGKSLLECLVRRVKRGKDRRARFISRKRISRQATYRKTGLAQLTHDRFAHQPARARYRNNGMVVVSHTSLPDRTR